MRSTFTKLILIPACFCTFIVCAETATIVSTSTLYQRPSIQATILQRLSSGTSVDFLARQGSWKQVATTQGKTGWVRSYQVRSGNITTPDKKTESGVFLAALRIFPEKPVAYFPAKKKITAFSIRPPSECAD